MDHDKIEKEAKEFLRLAKSEHPQVILTPNAERVALLAIRFALGGGCCLVGSHFPDCPLKKSAGSET